MFRNQYDTDVTVWSPQGHLHQVDYAMEAVKQGSVCLGLTSNEYVVLCGVKRQNDKLAQHQRKLYKIDDYMGIGMAGLHADARTLARYPLSFNERCKLSYTFPFRYMRTECLNHKFVYGSQIPIGRLVTDVADSKYSDSMYNKCRCKNTCREARMHSIVCASALWRRATGRRSGCKRTHHKHMGNTHDIS